MRKIATIAALSVALVGGMAAPAQAATQPTRTPCVKYINGVPVRTCGIFVPTKRVHLCQVGPINLKCMVWPFGPRFPR